MSFFLGDLRHQIFHSSNSNIRSRGKMWWHSSLFSRKYLISENLANFITSTFEPRNKLRIDLYPKCQVDFELIFRFLHKHRTLSFFLGDLRHQILPRAHRFKFEERKIWWSKSPKKYDKVLFSMFFHWQIIFLHKSKVDGLKKFLM